ALRSDACSQSAGGSSIQHVTWRMAFVSPGVRGQFLQGSSVGRITRSTLRRRLALHLLYDRKRSVSSRADNETSALPGYSLLDRDRGVSEVCAEFLRGLLLALANPSPVNNQTVLISNTIDFDRPEGEFAEIHQKPPFESGLCACTDGSSSTPASDP